MKYPRYTRQQDLRCKLTDKDIAEIRKLHSSGMNYSEISRVFNVSQRTIMMWCISDEERKRKQRDRDIRYGVYGDNLQRAKESIHRKYQIMQSYRQYVRFNTIRHRKRIKSNSVKDGNAAR